MSRLLILLVFLALLAGLTVKQADQMTSRPLLVKLGSAPNAKVISLIAGRYKAPLANWWVTKVLFYFGSLVDADKRQLKTAPEYFNMYKTLQAALYLDPYNMDAYYFAQASFIWGLGRVKEVNALLKRGMKYRNWDYQLPFYAGFNAAYFLHDYAEGARLMKIAAERSGSPLFTKLATRYFYQAKETDLGVVFIQSILRQTKDKKLRAVYQTRLEALQAVQVIENALKQYKKKFGHNPENLNELVANGFLLAVPRDPYGGIFSLNPDGSVVSSSKFAFAYKNQQKKK